MGLIVEQKKISAETITDKNEAVARLLWPDAYAIAGDRMEAPDFTTPEGRLQLLDRLMRRDDWLMFSTLHSVALNYQGKIFWIDTSYLFTPDKLRDAALEWLTGLQLGGGRVL